LEADRYEQAVSVDFEDNEDNSVEVKTPRASEMLAPLKIARRTASRARV
jgi:hypothetical protein